VNIIISIIIPTNNRSFILKNLLLELNKQKGHFEVIVIDDASQDNTELAITSIIDKLKYQLKYIRLIRHIGLPSARNVGIRNSNYKIIGFLDDDCIPIRDDLFTVAYKWLSLKNPKIVGVGGPAYIRSNTPDKKYKLGFVNTLPGGNSFFIKEYIDKVGGYDPNFDGNYFREDTDICMSLKKYGKLLFNPKMPVNHLLVTFGGCRKDFYYFYSNLISNTILLTLKHRKIYIETIMDSYYHLKNFFKILIKNGSKDIFPIKIIYVLKLLIRSFFSGIKKYLILKKK